MERDPAGSDVYTEAGRMSGKCQGKEGNRLFQRILHGQRHKDDTFFF